MALDERSTLTRLSALLAATHARHQLRRFFRCADRAAAVQERALLRLVRHNADSTFGRDHGFDHIHSPREFTDRVPIRTYADMTPYMDRVKAGETSALFGSGQRVVMFALTSGSTDVPKYIPVTDAFVRSYRRGWNIFGVKALYDHPGGVLRPILQVSSPMDERRTARGIPCGSISGLLAATQKRLVRKFYTSPPSTAYIADPQARYYTLMRLAVPRNVAFAVTANPATQLRLARSAQTHAQRLIKDVSDGTLSPPGEIDPAIRRRIADRLRPDRGSANRLSSILDRHGALLPKHYWDLKFLANWTGGTLALHLRDFPYYFGRTPVRDIGLLATEGRVSIGIEDGTPGGILDVEGGFFEFMEPDAETAPDPKSPPALRCHELAVGGEYRVLLTNAAGLYRYDLGDRIRVLEYLGQAPVVEFLHRGEHTASLTGEKLTEWQVAKAFERATRELDLQLDTFVLAPQWHDPPFYRLHVDHCKAQAEYQTDVHRLAQAVDRHLCRINLEYHSKRKSGRLGPIVANLLSDGYLGKLDAGHQAGRGASNEQYKHRYLYRQPGDDAAFPVAAPADRYRD